MADRDGDVGGAGGRTVAVPSSTPVASVASSPPRANRMSACSVSSTPRTRRSSTVVERVVRSPARSCSDVSSGRFTGRRRTRRKPDHWST
ncbi:hypothetical protein [Nocardioides zeae]